MRVLLVVYDNESYIHWFPQGIAYIAAVLRNKGLDVEIFNQDVHHFPDSYLKDYLDHNVFDLVGIGVTGGYYQYRKLLALAESINASKQRPFLVIGGHGPSPAPEFFMDKTQADAVVIGEGENTVCELVDAIASKKPLSEVMGIAYRDGEKVCINVRRDLIQPVDSLPHPAYDLFPMEYYRLLRMPNCENTDFVMPVLSGRGCPFKCNFCYRMDEGFRPRSNESIIEEISYLQGKYQISYVAFSDELLMSSVSRTKELCMALLNSGLNIKWDCNGRLNYARPDLLKLMKQAGCVFINYGIEAFDDQVLKLMNKSLTTQQIVKGIEATLAAGISPGLNIIFGNLGDTKESLRKGVEFLLKYDDGAQLRTIRPVTGYPGTELFDYAVKENLIEDVEDFYENKHTNSDLLSVNYTEMNDEEFYSELYQANVCLIKNFFKNKQKKMIEQAHQLYFAQDSSFRGYRIT